MNELFRKEFRDLVRWVPIGFLLASWAVWLSWPRSLHQCQFLSRSFVSSLGVVAGLVAFALGMLQSWPDARNDARGYLLHRPLSAASIFWAKIAAGFAAYALAILPPLAFSAWHLEFVAAKKLPVSGMQIVPVGLAMGVIFVLHPAAIWSVHREARWLGTKCFPLVFAGVGAAVASTVVMIGDLPSLAVFLGVAGVTWFISLWASRHAFTIQSHSPPPGEPNRLSRADRLGLTLAGVELLGLVGVVVAAFLADFQSQEHVYHRFAVSQDHQLWELAETQDYTIPATTKVLGRQISPNSSQPEWNTLPAGWKEYPLMTLYAKRLQQNWCWPYRYVGSATVGNNSYNAFGLFSRDGRIHAYQERRGPRYIITPKGFFTPEQPVSGRFDDVTQCYTLWQRGLHRFGLAGPVLLQDAQGIYQADFAAETIDTLVDQGADWVSIVPPDHDQAPMLWGRQGNSVHCYSIASSQGKPLELISAELVQRTREYAIPKIKLTPLDQWQIAAIDEPLSIQVCRLPTGEAVVLTPQSVASYEFKYVAPDRSVLQQGRAIATQTLPGSWVATWCAPPAMWCAAAAYHWWESSLDSLGIEGRMWVSVAVVALVSLLGACWYGSHAGLSWRRRCGWALLATGAGPGALLGMLAIHPRPIRQRCPHCQARRRIDRDRCDACQQEWPRPASEGIELHLIAHIKSPPVAV